MNKPEVLVIGAGPGGCVAAIEHARRGHSVWLCEASPAAAGRRLAGEWLHNTGRALLEDLEVDLGGSHVGRGFVVHPGDRSEPIVLPYVVGEAPVGLGRLLPTAECLQSASSGFSWEHEDLVHKLRARAAAEPKVRYLAGARVALEPGQGPQALTGDPDCAVEFEGKRIELRPDRIVDATGKAALGRRVLETSDAHECARVSRMCGLELTQVDVPLSEFGHVFLGGPGPMLMYRIREHSVRLIVDVPVWFAEGAKPSDAALLQHWGPFLPAELRGAFERALFSSKAKWVNISVRVRQNYGSGRVALIGDAVGHYHPLTATGMTNAVLDAQGLAQCDSVVEFAKLRTRRSKSAGLLGVALYDMFSRPEAEVERMRQALFARWRGDSKERRRTMGYLGMGDQRVTAFMASFLKVAMGGVRSAPSGERLAAMRQSATFLQARAPWLLKSFRAKTAAGPVMVSSHDNT